MWHYSFRISHCNYTISIVYRVSNLKYSIYSATMVQQTEVGVQDFVLLDEITLEKFMENLQKR